jgi:hypothetical protein
MKLIKFNSWAAPQEALYVRVLQVAKAISPMEWREGDAQIVALVLTFSHSTCTTADRYCQDTQDLQKKWKGLGTALRGKLFAPVFGIPSLGHSPA